MITACFPQNVPDTPLFTNVPIQLIPAVTSTPFKPISIEEEPDKNIILWVPDYLADLKIDWKKNSAITVSNDNLGAVCSLQIKNEGAKVGDLTFVLVEPFDSIQDQITIEELNKILIQGFSDQEAGKNIFVSESTYSVLSESMGNLSENIRISPEKNLFSSVSQSSGSYGLIQFDALEPQWKVLRIDSISPLDKHFDRENYLLNFPINVICDRTDFSTLIMDELVEELSNRSDEKITSILLTGTTALTRATADRMENFGNTFPGEKVKFWFENSDIRHISSETPFYNGCPPPNPIQKDLVFCSDPKYLELFTYLPVDIIELTGNHLLDKGVDAFENTLVLLSQTDLKYYAAGFSEEEAQKPLLIEHNGNKIAFFGCNQAGPPNVWATETRSGVNNCNIAGISDQIRALKQEGYLPIVTFQYFESNSMAANASQMRDFREMVTAGAVIVSGSQSHVPMSMEIYQGAFIHYGLGNLFFDQMDSINNRQEFLDRHIFYDGRYIGTELLTAMLENYAQPRPMTENERISLLQDAFRNFIIIFKEN
jgi:poly-gamma-glutamate synthesis protein (capsule biosynthesis protein)